VTTPDGLIYELVAKLSTDDRQRFALAMAKRAVALEHDLGKPVDENVDRALIMSAKYLAGKDGIDQDMLTKVRMRLTPDETDLDEEDLELVARSMVTGLAAEATKSEALLMLTPYFLTEVYVEYLERRISSSPDGTNSYKHEVIAILQSILPPKLAEQGLTTVPSPLAG